MHSDFDTTTQEYVEIIYEIQKKKKVARVKEIAKQRGVTRSSVSTALNLLKKKKLINHENYGLVELTDEGQQLGEELEERHQIIKDFFIDILSINPEIAEQDACILEHHISTQVLDSFVGFIAFIKNYPDWLKEFKSCEEYTENT
jgi:DtxR family Mn-dependent transcriptional regulator